MTPNHDPSSTIWSDTAVDSALANLVLPAPGAALTPATCQDLALLVARRGAGRVAPNPLVGAVCVDAQHRFISAGAHEQIGHEHAEVQALRVAKAAGMGDRLQGGMLYVTLEPCAHAGRTPACAPQVAASGVRHVVYGIVDPNPQVQGRGAAILQAAGVTATLDPAWSPACADLAQIFLWTIAHGTPFVGLKVATSLDGVMARPGDQRAWITGPRARAYGHFLRVSYDALVIGRGTLLADDPLLDTRDSLWPGRAPRRVVLDPDGAGLLAEPPGEWRLLSQAPAGAAGVVWITGERLSQAATKAAQSLTARGACWRRLPVDGHGLFTPQQVLQTLGALGMSSLLLEGGGGLYAPFLRARAVNHLHLFQAPKVLGTHGARYFAAGTGELALRRPRVTQLGDDWLVDGALERPV